ncbi:hypothetical protein AB0285_14265, partial [Microbacterium oleivorans]|uniref:hypothetical protein n=1 Tax=Microbacterium oleivorans TaxID=273677 RepID=UPI00344D88FF
MVDEHPTSAGCAQLGLLGGGVLIPRRNTGIADDVHTPLPRYPPSLVDGFTENGSAQVSGRLGFGGGFRWICDLSSGVAAFCAVQVTGLSGGL